MSEKLLRQALFTVPLYKIGFPQHEKNKELYRAYVDKLIDNSPVVDRLDKISSTTKKALHTVPVFEELVGFLGSLCPRIHEDFDISLDKSIAVSAMWCTRCEKHEFIPNQTQSNGFLYGAYFLQAPPNSGDILITNEIADRNYFGNIWPDSSNTINTNVFQGQIPEGEILLMPAHLTTSYTFNYADDNRYILNFILQVLF